MGRLTIEKKRTYNNDFNMFWLWRQRHLKKGCNDDARDDGKDGDAMIARILRE